MRFARKFMLHAVAAIAAAALVAPAASAIETVEVVDERTGAHCPAVTFGSGGWTGGCKVHAAGLITLRIDFGVFGEVNEATCDLELVALLDEAGGGRVTAVNTSTGAGQEVGCPTVFTECNLPWSASAEEDGATGVTPTQLSICIDPAESNTNCVGTLPFDIVEYADEQYETHFDNSVVGLCELDVDLALESDELVVPDGCPREYKYAEIHINHP